MKAIVTFLAAAGLVAGHGYVDNATIGGQFYQVSPGDWRVAWCRTRYVDMC